MAKAYFIRLTLTQPGTHTGTTKLGAFVLMEELQPSHLPTAMYPNTRVSCVIPTQFIGAGFVVEAIENVAAIRREHDMDPVCMRPATKNVIISSTPLEATPTDEAHHHLSILSPWPRAPPIQPRLKSVHWRMDGAVTGVETYAAVLEWDADCLDAHSYAMYHVFCGKRYIGATRGSRYWIDAYVGPHNVGDRVTEYTVHVR
jgi:hypothetical protein